MKTIADVSQETLAIEAYITTVPPGETISYTAIQMATGVQMDQAGKSKLRTAIRRAGRVSACVRNYGIRLSDEHSTLSIIGEGVKRTRNAMRKVEREGGIMTAQHGSKMAPEDLAIAQATVSAFAAFRISAESRSRELASIAKMKPKLAPPVGPTV